MANRWTRNDYNRGGEGEDIRREQRRLERGQQNLDDQYGRSWEDNDRYQQSQDSYAPFGTTRGPNFGSSYDRNYGENYGGEGEYYRRSGYRNRQTRDFTGGTSNRDYDQGYREAARFERESHYGMDRDPEWKPYRGRNKHHDHDHDHDRDRDYHESRDYRRELDRETDRGPMNRTRDEVSSWFGNDDAKRRRELDEMRDDMHDRERDMERSRRRYRTHE
jgi:hypothetical protein